LKRLVLIFCGIAMFVALVKYALISQATRCSQLQVEAQKVIDASLDTSQKNL